MIKKLYQPIDIAILVYFRFFAGCFLSIELINSLFLGDFNEYTDPAFHFSYHLFEWVKPWPLWGMVVHYFITILAGFLVAFGFYYRISSVILCLGYTSLFLMEKSEYTNHFYLYCLISFWMAWLPLHKAGSYDAKKNPSIVQTTAPAWMLYLLLFHISIVYFFAGVAKLNPDWLAGSPMDMFFKYKSQGHPLSFLFSRQYAPLIASYGGLLFDLLIVPLMLMRRTRKGGFILAIFFHLSNVMMFGLATFPWFSIMMTSMFFPPCWPRKIKWLNKHLPPPRLGKPLVSIFDKGIKEKVVAGFLLFYCLVHLLLPLRHWLYPGDPSWTEEGHQFAWRMMLRSKNGSLNFYVQNPVSKERQSVKPGDYLTSGQYRDMLGKPDMILQFAHFLTEEYKRDQKGEIEVYARCRISLNGKPPREMIGRDINLAKEKRSLAHYEWILLLNN